MIRPVAINTLRSRLAGVGLFSMIVLSMASVVWSPLLTAAAALTWLCALVLWHRLGTQLKLQFAAVTSVGLLGLVWGVRHDGELDPIALFTQNQLIISMLGAVSMLRLLNPVGAGKTEDLPTGRGAFIKSILGLHCFGALINISALVIMGDRLSRNQPLQPFEAVCISRVFTTAVFYSPFIGGMALALASTPGSSLSHIMIAGLTLAMLGLVTLFLLASIGNPEAVAAFRGYPVRWESLWLPALLAGLVIVAHGFLPDVSVLTLIIVLCPSLAVFASVLKEGPADALESLADFTVRRLPELSGELALFLGAGVLASGLFATFSALQWQPFEVLDARAASLTLMVAVALATIGIHPIVVVSTIIPLFTPLAPAPNLMAFLCVACWGIGCAVCPMSGTNVTIQARYGVSNWRVAYANLLYGGLMTLFAIGLFFALNDLLTRPPD